MAKDEILSDDDLMQIHSIQRIDVPRVKIESPEDYYHVFVGMLKSEDDVFYDKEHAWVLGINDFGYSVCCYMVALGAENFVAFQPRVLFRTSLLSHCNKIVLCHNHADYHVPIQTSEEDFDFTSRVYHQCKLLEIEFYDHMIICLASLTSQKPIYLSYTKNNMFGDIEGDIRYKTCLEAEEFYEEAKIEFGKEQRKEGKKEGRREGKKKGRYEAQIAIARSMLVENMDMETILRITKLSKDEIAKIQRDIDRYK